MGRPDKKKITKNLTLDPDVLKKAQWLADSEWYHCTLGQLFERLTLAEWERRTGKTTANPPGNPAKYPPAEERMIMEEPKPKKVARPGSGGTQGSFA